MRKRLIQLTTVACALLVPVGLLAFKNPLKWKETLNLNIASCATGANRLQTDTAFGSGSTSYFFTDDGGSFVDDTTDAGDAGTGDVAIWPTTPAVNDAIYYGSDTTFNMLRFDIGTQGSTVMTVLWEYYDGDSWETLTQTRTDVADWDEAAGNTHFNNFDPPSDWAATTVNSQSAYWVRQRVSAFTSTTTAAVGDQIWLGDAADVPARYVVIAPDPDETEDYLCGQSGTAADVGFYIKAGTGSLGIETELNAHEVYCCGDGGAVDISVIVMDDNA